MQACTSALRRAIDISFDSVVHWFVGVTPFLAGLLLTGLIGAGPVNAGVVAAPTSVVVNDTVLGDFQVAEVSVANTEAIPVTIRSVAISAPAESLPFWSTTADSACLGATLAMGDSCVIVVRFAPTVGGAFVASLNVDFGADVLRIPLAANAGTRSATASTSTVSFGNVTVGTAVQYINFSVLNDGTLPFSIAGNLQNLDVAPFGPFGFFGECVGATVAVGHSCALGITFAPTTTGSFAYDIKALLQTASSYATVYKNNVIEATGTGIAAALAPPSVGLTIAPSVVQTGQIATLTVTLHNSATTNLSSGYFIMQYPAGIVGGAPANSTCASETLPSAGANSLYQAGILLAPGAACTISVTVSSQLTGSFTFTAGPGAFSSSMGPNGNSASASLLVRSAPQAKIGLSPDTLTFLLQTVGSTSDPQMVKVSSLGEAPLTIESILGKGEFGFSSDCPMTPNTLDPGGSCNISITYMPISVGIAAGKITVYSSASNGVASAALNGESVSEAVPAARVEPASLSFAETNVGGTSAAQTIKVTNSGLALLKISGINVSGAFTINHTCGVTLAPKASCSVEVRFTPTVDGDQAGLLVISHDAKGGSTSASLRGKALTRPEALIKLSGGGDLGDQQVGGVGPARPVTITNTGTIDMSVGGVALDGADPGDFRLEGNCGVIAPKASCGVLVRFAPTESGTRSARVVVSSNARNPGDGTIGVSGRGVPKPKPVAALSVSALGFGSVIYGGSAPAAMVTLSNRGTADMQVRSITVSGSDYRVNHSCPSVLGVQDQCVIAVNFSPMGLGARTGVMSVLTNIEGDALLVQLSGAGCRYYSPSVARSFLTSC